MWFVCCGSVRYDRFLGVYACGAAWCEVAATGLLFILTNWWLLRKEKRRRKRRKCPTQTHCRSRGRTRKRWSLSWSSPKRRRRCTNERSSWRSVDWFRRYEKTGLPEQVVQLDVNVSDVLCVDIYMVLTLWFQINVVTIVMHSRSTRIGLIPLILLCAALALYQVSETEREDLEESEKVQHWVERLCQTRLEQISCVENESPEVPIW